MVAEALEAYGITDVFASPGSRNAPLLMAMNRREAITVRPVVDERSAAFIALGYSLVSQRPAALVCTSGSALLNYAPAVAEAYYRKLPLIIISADRPSEWIGQDDSQTLPQLGAFGSLVKCSVSLKGEIASELEIWETNRNLNEAMQTALSGRRGPVHINVALSNPLTAEVDNPEDSFRKIELLEPYPGLNPTEGKRLAAETAGRNVLIVGGFCQPSETMNSAFASLAKCGNIVVAADALANLSCGNIIPLPDLAIRSELLKDPDARPDILITFGGSLISSHLKDYLRSAGIREHWHVGENDALIDSYFSLTKRIEIPEGNFFRYFAKLIERQRASQTRFKELWWQAVRSQQDERIEKLADASWDEEKAIDLLMSRLPGQWNLQLSNGLTPRYALRSQAWRFHRRDCNRGVSGIDGSISTALGASLAFKGTTLLVTGDMSMQYDIAALSSTLLSARLKIVVINNGGGGIFEKIQTTRNLPELPELLKCQLRLPLEKLAEGYGLRYFRVSSEEELLRLLPEFINEQDLPSLLEVFVTSN